MRRNTTLVLVAVGAAVVGLGFAIQVAEPLRDDDSTEGATTAAGPQIAELGWRETFGPKGERLEFSVDRFQVLRGGWRARVSVTNDSAVAYEAGGARRAFGLMLFSTGNHDDLEERVRRGTLPALRGALRYEPSLPSVLEPHSSWKGTISASGALVAGSWVRFVFGTLVAVGRTPDELPDRIDWITDHAYPLRR